MQHKRHSVELTAQVTATDFNQKVHSMSWPCTTAQGYFNWTISAFQSEAISNCYTYAIIRGMCDYCSVMVSLSPRSVFPIVKSCPNSVTVLILGLFWGLDRSHVSMPHLDQDILGLSQGLDRSLVSMPYSWPRLGYSAHPGAVLRAGRSLVSMPYLDQD